MHYRQERHIFPSLLQSTELVWENNFSKMDNRHVVAGVNLDFMETRSLPKNTPQTKQQKTKNNPPKVKKCVSIFLQRVGKT